MPTAPPCSDIEDSGWKGLCKIGGVTALVALLIAPAEILINFLPGVAQESAGTVTAIDWFNLFHNYPLLALRDLGLLNLCGAALLVPTILAIFYVLRRDNEAYAILGAVLFFVGIAVYFAGNRAFPMLSLSGQYATAATDAQRSLLAAAGRAMLTEGQSRAGILLIEFACLIISAVMVRGDVFGKVTAYAGMLGNGLMMIVEIAFIPPRGVGIVIASCGGLLLITWYFLIGWTLLRLVGSRSTIVDA
jgi:hypothetical protein